MARMPAHLQRICRRYLRRGSLLLALWLTVCLVGTQIAGLGHRIEHPTGDGRPLLVGAHQHEHGLDDAHAHDAVDLHAAHHCAAYDAATLGNGPPVWLASTQQPPPPTSGIAVEPEPRAGRASHLAFRPRAPPRA